MDLPKTTEAKGHTHTVSDPAMLWTDPAPDGHKHRINRGCSTCKKIRNTMHLQTVPTSYEKGHIHFFSHEMINR